MSLIKNNIFVALVITLLQYNPVISLAQVYVSEEPDKAWVYFSPDKDNERIVVNFINDTKSTLYVAAYSLTNEKIAGAISDARNRKIDVALLCDKQQAQIKSALCTTIRGKIDKKSGLMHNKFIVRDERCILTGSFNFTNNAIKNNRENFIIICNDEVAKVYSQEFKKLWTNNT